jgi:pyruvate-ferredoxin/flavodoxin oxidoreductase
LATDPVVDFQDFLMGEVRYSSLVQSFPDEAAKLHKKLEDEYAERYETYKEIAESE